MTDWTNERVDAAIALINKGATIDECVAIYPEADELRPMLEAAATYRRAQAEGLSAETRDRLRTRVMATWDRQPAAKARFDWTWLRLWSAPRFGAPRWAAAALAILLLLAFSSTGTVLASGRALPGDPLYSVKELRENATLWLTISPAAKVAVYTNLVRERTDEIRRLAASNQSDGMLMVTGRLQQHVQAIETIVHNDLPLSLAVGSSSANAVAAEQAALNAVEQAIGQVPTSARPKLEDELTALQQAQDRVGAALEQLRTATESTGSSDIAH